MCPAQMRLKCRLRRVLHEAASRGSTPRKDRLTRPQSQVRLRFAPRLLRMVRASLSSSCVAGTYGPSSREGECEEPVAEEAGEAYARDGRRPQGAAGVPLVSFCRALCFPGVGEWCARSAFSGAGGRGWLRGPLCSVR